MELITIKKWGPIIEKLDSTYSLTEDQKKSLCNYCEDYMLNIVNTGGWATMNNGMGMGAVSFEDMVKQLPQLPKNDTLLPILLKIYYNVIIELSKENITVIFSNDFEPEPQMNFDNGTVTFTSTSDFETKYSSIEIKDELDEYLKGFGIDAFKRSESVLINFTIDNLIALGKQNGELCIHVSGNSLQIISEPTLSKSMVLTYKIKNIKK